MKLSMPSPDHSQTTGNNGIALEVIKVGKPALNCTNESYHTPNSIFCMMSYWFIISFTLNIIGILY